MSGLRDKDRPTPKASSRQDRMVAIILIVGGIVAALFFIGLFTDWYGLFSNEVMPDPSRDRPID